MNNTNARDEFINHVGGRQIQCAVVDYHPDYGRSGAPYSLRDGFAQPELTSFLSSLNFQYDSGYGGQELYGTIWFTDGTWSTRGEYDGSEWWEHHERPEIPGPLKA